VLKTTHTEVVSKVKLALKQKAKAVREAKRQAEQQARQAAYDAELQAQRDANGGLTDDQVAYKKAYEARKEQLARTNAIVAPVVSVLDAAGGDFCFSIAQGYRNGLLPQGRAKDIVIEIVAKQSGRKGSAAYDAALAGAQELVESIETAIKQNY
jgi:hypothetical protein